MYKRLYIFQGDFKVLKLQYFKLLCVLLLPDTIQNPIRYLRRSFLLEAINSFHEKIHLKHLGSE